MKKILLSLLCIIVFFSICFAQKGTDTTDSSSADDAYLNELLQKKSDIDKLYLVDDQKRINKSFSKQEKLLKRYHKKDDVDSYKFTLYEIRIVYADVPELNDRILYYRGELAFLVQNLSSSQNLFEELLNSYYSTTKKNDAISKLCYIYASTEQDEKLIEISKGYTAKKDDQLKFWIAQAYYNTEEYNKARNIFSTLKKKTFRFRAETVLALIAYLEEGNEAGLVEFRSLEKRYNSKTPYYSIVYLSLARILIELEQPELALLYYDKYYNLEQVVSDEILFEMALGYKNQQQYERAITLFQEIVSRSTRSSYSAPAKFYLALTLQEQGNFELGKNDLEEIISGNKLLLETLSTKYKLIEKYDELSQKNIADGLSEDESAKLEKRLITIEATSITSNHTVRGLYQGENENSLRRMALLEQEIFSYSNTVSDMESVIRLAYATKNKRIPRLIDRRIALNDTTIVSLQNLHYIGHMRNITPQQYEFAKLLTIERFMQEDLQAAWIDVDRYARQKNRPKIAQYAEKSLGILDANIESLDLIAKYLFNGEPSEEVKGYIANEINELRINNNELADLKIQAMENFNKKIARRLETQKSILIDEFAILKQTYYQSIGGIMDEVRSSNVEYETNILDLLFKQSQLLDEQYKEKQKEYSDSRYE